jgi:peptidoglycan/LPS O-acetylase OafA/YrhL
MFTQFTPSQRVQYEIPSRTYDIYDRRRQTDAEDVAAIASFVFSLLLAIVIAEWSMWRLVSKAGYQGVGRWVWFVFLGCPVTTIWSLLVFVLVPWPVQKQLKAKQQQLEPVLDPVEAELRQMRQQIRGEL